jgi:signal recognition particle GTPase
VTGNVEIFAANGRGPNRPDEIIVEIIIALLDSDVAIQLVDIFEASIPSSTNSLSCDTAYP